MNQTPEIHTLRLTDAEFLDLCADETWRIIRFTREGDLHLVQAVRVERPEPAKREVRMPYKDDE